MSLKYTYLSQKELIARLVGYSSRATALFTGTLRVKLQGIVNAKYELGLLSGAIVFCKGSKSGIPLYGNTALRSLVEDLSNPNIVGDLSFIEAKPYEIEAQVAANPLIALQTPVYFEDLSTLVLADIETTPTPVTKKPAILLRRTKTTSRKSMAKHAKRETDFKLKKISSDKLYREYTEFLGRYYRELLQLTKYIGLLTAKSPRDLSELLSKYSSNKGLIIAHVKPEHGLTECILAIYRRRILGVYCYSAGLELKNTNYTQPFNECSPSCSVELYELDYLKLSNTLKEKVLHVVDTLDNGIYYGTLGSAATKALIRYYVTLYNKRITRLGGTITIGNRTYNISRNLAKNILVNILTSNADSIKPLGTRDLRKAGVPWIQVSEKEWNYAVNVARRILKLQGD